MERGLPLPELLNGASKFISGLQLKSAARAYALGVLITSIGHVTPMTMLNPFKNAVEISTRP